jgi:hypothetical protein
LFLVKRKTIPPLHLHQIAQQHPHVDALQKIKLIVMLLPLAVSGQQDKDVGVNNSLKGFYFRIFID